MKLKAYGYTRLSRDDKGENYDSILSQNKLIEEYCNNNNWELDKVYEDDNISGYYFGNERKGLEELKQDISKGFVKILIVKDLSRIGRHNAHTLLFLDFLKEYDVRLILLSKNYDSFKDNDDIMGIETWYNERYIKDISKKIKDNLRIKQKEGTYINKVPYGYYKNKKTNHIEIDNDCCDTVKFIFKSYINGLGSRKIAESLNDKKTLCPASYYNSKNNTNLICKNKWDNTQILRMLKNDFYIGHHRCGKTFKKIIKGKTIHVESDNQYIHKNNHEALIDVFDFDLAQKIIKDRNEKTIRSGNDGISLFSGFLYCGECESKMIIKRNLKNGYPIFYLCRNYNDNGKKACSTHSIQEKKLIDIILKTLLEISDYCKDYLNDIDNKLVVEKRVNSNIDNTVQTIKNKIEITKEDIKKYIRQIIKNPENEDLIKELIQESNNNLKYYNEQMEDLIKHKNYQKESKEKILKSYDILQDMIIKKELNRKILEIFLDKIIIHQLNKITKQGQRPQLKVEIQLNAFFENVKS